MMKGAERRMEKEKKDCPLKRSAEVKRLFERIEKLKKEKAVVILGIDGMCGSGKTTLARLIEDSFQDVVIVHMDDFFLPPELRSPERYAERKRWFVGWMKKARRCLLCRSLERWKNSG